MLLRRAYFQTPPFPTALRHTELTASAVTSSILTQNGWKSYGYAETSHIFLLSVYFFSIVEKYFFLIKHIKDLY